MRSFSFVQIVFGLSLLACVLVVALPAFSRNLHASYAIEATDGLAELGARAVQFARDRPSADAFPPSAPWTPSEPPRGVATVDPPGAWDASTWQALGFRPVPDETPHRFAFRFESTKSRFVATAQGDLDGDGVRSTFEITGISSETGPIVSPGMYVEAEFE